MDNKHKGNIYTTLTGRIWHSPPERMAYSSLSACWQISQQTRHPLKSSSLLWDHKYSVLFSLNPIVWVTACHNLILVRNAWKNPSTSTNFTCIIFASIHLYSYINLSSKISCEVGNVSDYIWVHGLDETSKMRRVHRKWSL